MMDNEHSSKMITLAAIECGGTSFRVAIFQITKIAPPGHDDGGVVEMIFREKIYTSIGVQETLDRVSTILRLYATQIQAVGIASFGPVGVNPYHIDTYGTILNTSPKQEWRNIHLIQTVQLALGSNSLHIPILIDTDVNAPAMAEFKSYLRYQQQQTVPQTIRSCAYVTVGTGVGVGLVINDQTVHGLMHPEMGHISVPRQIHLENQEHPFTGYSWGRRQNSSCPFHGSYTVEGLTSSVALTERYYHYLNNNNSDPSSTTKHESEYDRNILSSLSDDDEIWDHAAHVIGSLCTTLFLSVSVERIVLGGGVVMGRVHLLLPKIHAVVIQQLNGYLQPIQTLPDVEQRIVISQYGDDAGLYGAIYLAQEAFVQHTDKLTSKTDTNCDIAIDKRKKQIAFQHGLWHGIIVGIVGTGLFMKYWWKDGKQRR
jgi:fructokinase